MSRFLLDMGVSPKVVKTLSSLGHSAEHAKDLGLSEADDATIFQKAVDDGQVVITTDLDFGHLAVVRSKRFPGLILLRLQSPSAVEMCETLREFLSDRDAEAYGSCIVVLERGRFRRTRIPLQSQ